MTRAKRAMYLITEPGPANSSARTLPRLVQAALGMAWAGGDPNWFRDCRATEASKPAVDGIAPLAVERLSPRKPRHASRTPSGLEATLVTGAQLFALDRAATSDFGHRVHELFAEIEWGSAADWDAKAQSWATHGVASEEVLACLRAPELATIWQQKERAEVWREKPFEIVLDGMWVTGVFDRVVIERNGKGKAMSATVIDYKTDRVATEGDVVSAVMRHGAQLNLYRRVVSVLAGIPVRAVSCDLLLTRLRRRVSVPAG
jgi:ATP-dependent exoDNAse (exonuclease V) beta subunit